MIRQNRRKPFKLNIGLLKFLDPVTGTLLDNLLQSVARMELKGSYIHRNRCRKNNPIPQTLHLEIGKNRILLAGHIRKADHIVLGQVFQGQTPVNA